jgi:ribosomal protein S18 acetylase RimI-like enzyme
MSQPESKNLPANQSQRQKNSRAITSAKASRALHFLHRYGFLRSQELGALMSPQVETSAKSGEAIVRQLRAEGYINEIDLPDRAGRAIVLSKLGAQFLTEMGVSDAVENSDWFDFQSKKPRIPITWMHDLAAIRVLVHMEEIGHDVIPEYTIRKLHPKGFSILGGIRKKRPDGLIKLRDVDDGKDDEDSWSWLEVERSRKRGSDMQDLANIILKVYEHRTIQDAFSTSQMALPFVTQVVIVHPTSVHSDGKRMISHPRLIRSELIETIKKKEIWISDEDPLVVPFIHIDYLNYTEFSGGINYLAIADGYDELADRSSSRKSKIVGIAEVQIDTQDNLPERDTQLIEYHSAGDDSPTPVAGFFQLACFARTANGTLIGGIIGGRSKTRCQVTEMWVREDFRRAGIGTLLVRAFESRAREYGCDSFVLETFNEAAFHFFRTLDYEAVLVLEALPHGAMRYTMTKKIDE